MKQFKFHNETFDFDFVFLVYDYKDKSQCDTLLDMLVNLGFTKPEVKNAMQNCNGVFFGSDPCYIVIDASQFDLCTHDGISSLIEVIQHECGHLRQHVLEEISEKITITDAESHLRISDWAFKKCLGTLFMKCLFKVKSK